jgi:hypothetical protein
MPQWYVTVRKTYRWNEVVEAETEKDAEEGAQNLMLLPANAVSVDQTIGVEEVKRYVE